MRTLCVRMVCVRGRGCINGYGCALHTGHDVGIETFTLLLSKGSPAATGAFGDLQFYTVVGFGSVFGFCTILGFSSHDTTFFVTEYHNIAGYVNSAFCTNYGPIYL